MHPVKDPVRIHSILTLVPQHVRADPTSPLQRRCYVMSQNQTKNAVPSTAQAEVVGDSSVYNRIILLDNCVCFNPTLSFESRWRMSVQSMFHFSCCTYDNITLVEQRLLFYALTTSSLHYMIDIGFPTLRLHRRRSPYFFNSL